jgi:hypothetical protein
MIVGFDTAQDAATELAVPNAMMSGRWKSTRGTCSETRLAIFCLR